MRCGGRQAAAWGLVGGLVLGWGLIPGCGGDEPAAVEAPTPFRGLNLTVAAVGDREILEAVRVQSGEWAREQGVELAIQAEPLKPEAAGKAADVLIFRGDALGELIDAGALAEIPETVVRPVNTLPLGQRPRTAGEEPESDGPAIRPDPLDFADVVQPYREQVGKYGESRIGLPLGGTGLVLAYRRDAFENAANRQAAASAGVELVAPQTWEQLDALARFFHDRDWDGDGQPEAGLAVAMGADPEGVADTVLLARAAALGLSPDRYEFLFDAETMAPRVASPPFVEALQGLVALKDLGPEGMANFDAEAARTAFREGRAALLIDRAERASRWTDPKAPAPVAVSALPGSTRVYDPGRQQWRTPATTNQPGYLPVGGGWLAGVSARTEGPAREAAVSFVRTLATPEISGAIVADPAFPMLSVRGANLGLGLPDPGAALGVESKAWGDAVSRTLAAPRVVVGLRIPGTPGYLADLNAARVAAVGGTPAADALNTAAQAWEQRTESLGRTRQLWHYRRSLNALSTAKEPPPPR